MSNNPNFTHKLFTSRLPFPASQYIGESGRLFYHEDTGELRLSDGKTPGGLPVTGGASGNITLIGDITAFGAIGSNIVTTLSTVNPDTGSFGNAAYVPVITVNSKGLITSITSIPFSGGTSTAVILDGDVTASGYTGSNTTVTLNTVNSNIGEFGDAFNVPQFTVNEKGLITASANIAIGILNQDTTGNANNSSYLGGVPAAGYELSLGYIPLDSLTFTEANIIVQLGYTPYDANVNANGYITASDSITGSANNAVYLGGVPAADYLVSGGALGVPSSGNASNLTGTATGLTVGNVIHIPNLTGDVTSIDTATTLATVNSNIGMFGDSGNVAHFTVNNKGLITSASNISIPNTVQISGDATSTGGTTSANAIVTLNTVNSNVGTFGSSTVIPVFTVNNKGLITAASNQAIVIANITPAFGEMTIDNNGTGTVMTNQNQFYPITAGWVIGDCYEFSYSSGNIIANAAGTYSMFATISANCTSSNQVLQFNMFQNNTSIVDHIAVTKFVNSTDVDTVTITGVLENVLVGDMFGLRVQNTTSGGQTCVVGYANYSMIAVGGTLLSPGTGNVVLSGDVSASGPLGANLTTTLSTVNSNTGQFGDTTHVPQFTVNNKGLITASSNVSISFPAQVYPSSGIPKSNGSAWLSSYSTSGTGNVVLDTSPSMKGTISGNIAGNITSLNVAANLIAVDFSLSNNFSVTLQANTGQTLSNVTNATAGQAGQISITQNAFPSTLAFAANWISTDGTVPTVSTTANVVNLLSYYTVDSNHIWFVLNKHGVA